MSKRYPGCAPDCEERANCRSVGEVGHLSCGVCPTHDQPRHHCGCIVLRRLVATDWQETDRG